MNKILIFYAIFSAFLGVPSLASSDSSGQQSAVLSGMDLFEPLNTQQKAYLYERYLQFWFAPLEIANITSEELTLGKLMSSFFEGGQVAEKFKQLVQDPILLHLKTHNFQSFKSYQRTQQIISEDLSELRDVWPENHKPVEIFLSGDACHISRMLTEATRNHLKFSDALLEKVVDPPPVGLSIEFYAPTPIGLSSDNLIHYTAVDCVGHTPRACLVVAFVYMEKVVHALQLRNASSFDLNCSQYLINRYNFNRLFVACSTLALKQYSDQSVSNVSLMESYGFKDSNNLNLLESELLNLLDWKLVVSQDEFSAKLRDLVEGRILSENL